MTLQRFTESMAVPRPKGAPPRQRGSGPTPPPAPTVTMGGTARARIDHGGNNVAPPAGPAPALRPAKLARTPVKRWDGQSRRPKMGGALSAKGKLQEGAGLQRYQPLLEYNPYHDARGRFTGSGGAKTTVAYSGRRPGAGGVAGAMKRRAEREQAAASRGESLRTMVGKRSMGGGEGKHAMAADLYRQARLHKGADRRSVRDEAQGWSKDARAQSGRSSDYVKVPQRPKRYTQKMSDGQSAVGAKGAAAQREVDAAFAGSPRLYQDRRSASGDRAAHRTMAAKIRNERLAQQQGRPRANTTGQLRGERAKLPGTPRGGAGHAPATKAAERRAANAAEHGSPRLAQWAGSERPNSYREGVPQDPKKYTRRTSSGAPERGTKAAAVKSREQDDRVLAGGNFDSRRVNLARDAAAREAAGFNLSRDETPARARAAAAHAHNLAAAQYRAARERKAKGFQGADYARREGDSAKRAAKAAERKGKIPGVDVSPGHDPKAASAAMLKIAAQMRAEGRHADADWTEKAAAAIANRGKKSPTKKGRGR